MTSRTMEKYLLTGISTLLISGMLSSRPLSHFSHGSCPFLEVVKAQTHVRYLRYEINMINDIDRNNYSMQEISLDFTVNDTLSLHILLKMFLHVLTCRRCFPCCHVIGNCRSIVSMLHARVLVIASGVSWDDRWTWINLNTFQVLFCLYVWSVGAR